MFYLNHEMRNTKIGRIDSWKIGWTSAFIREDKSSDDRNISARLISRSKVREKEALFKNSFLIK